nr:hypothetical protein [Tanacetum cinerariifolium]
LYKKIFFSNNQNNKQICFIYITSPSRGYRRKKVTGQRGRRRKRKLTGERGRRRKVTGGGGCRRKIGSRGGRRRKVRSRGSRRKKAARRRAFQVPHPPCAADPAAQPLQNPTNHHGRVRKEDKWVSFVTWVFYVTIRIGTMIMEEVVAWMASMDRGRSVVTRRVAARTVHLYS